MVLLMSNLMIWTSSTQALDITKAKHIAVSNACMGCHTFDRKIVGPAYKDIIRKYNGDKNAVAKLVKKVRTGGSGVWGAIPMPAYPGLSDADAKTVVDWIMIGAPMK